METKRCCICKEIKPVNNFSNNKSSPDGLKNYCKECAARQNAKYRAEHKDEIRDRKRIAYREAQKQKAERTADALARGTKTCSSCGAVKPVSEFYERGDGGLTSRCKSCEMEAQKNFRVQNKEAVAEQKRGYNQKRKSKIAEYNHAYSKAHSEENKARAKRWREANPQRARETHSACMQRRRARKANTESSFTKADWRECKAYFTESDGLHCAYCGKHLERATQDHVIPVAVGGGYVRDNILPVCASCNSSKGSKEIWPWYREQSFYLQDRENKIREYLKYTAND